MTPTLPDDAPEQGRRVVHRHDGELVARLCERVYRGRLGADAARMVEKDGDGGTKLRARAMAYEPTVRLTLDALSREPLDITIAALLAARAALTTARGEDRSC